MSQNVHFEEQIAVSQVELAILMRRGFKHLASGSTGQLPSGTFKYPQIAAEQAAVLATTFAAQLHTSEDLDQWVQSMEDAGLDTYHEIKKEGQ